MDYFETLRENELLKKEIESLKTVKKIDIESVVVTAFKNSDEYRALEINSFYSFLQDKFITEFSSSKHATMLLEQAQTRFKEFEKNYNNKEEKTNGSSDKGFKKEVSRPNNK